MRTFLKVTGIILILVLSVVLLASQRPRAVMQDPYVGYMQFYSQPSAEPFSRIVSSISMDIAVDDLSGATNALLALMPQYSANLISYWEDGQGPVNRHYTLEVQSDNAESLMTVLRSLGKVKGQTSAGYFYHQVKPRPAAGYFDIEALRRQREEVLNMYSHITDPHQSLQVQRQLSALAQQIHSAGSYHPQDNEISSKQYVTVSIKLSQKQFLPSFISQRLQIAAGYLFKVVWQGISWIVMVLTLLLPVIISILIITFSIYGAIQFFYRNKPKKAITDVEEQ